MGFQFFRSLTVDHTQCGGSDSSSFPVLVSGSDATLKDSGHGGHVNSSAGADILFFSDSGLTSQLPSEIDFYDNVNGVLVAWVQLNVSHSVNTTFYIAYGNAAPPARTTNPWDGNYVGVYHLPNGSSLTANDSTTGGIGNGVVTGATAATGQIDGGAAFVSGSNQYIDMGLNVAVAKITNNITMEVWAKSSSASLSNVGWIDQFAAGSSTGTGIFFNSSGGAQTTGSMSVGVGNGTSVEYQSVVDSGSTDAAWHHWVFTFASGAYKLYKDGVLVINVTGSNTSISYATTNHVYLGRNQAGNGYYTGSFDEARISNTVRLADWITTEYNNQSSPGNIGSPGFLTWGAETSPGGGGFLALLGVGI